MAELRGGARFAQETVAQVRITGVVRRQQLDRHEPVEPDLTGEIHDPHSAAPELALQRITAGERGLELEEKAVRLVGHEEMLPYCHLYRPSPPGFRFSALCPTTNPTSRRASRLRS